MNNKQRRTVMFSLYHHCTNPSMYNLTCAISLFQFYECTAVLTPLRSYFTFKNSSGLPILPWCVIIQFDSFLHICFKFSSNLLFLFSFVFKSVSNWKFQQYWIWLFFILEHFLKFCIHWKYYSSTAKLTIFVSTSLTRYIKIDIFIAGFIFLQLVLLLDEESLCLNLTVVAN